MEEMPCSRVVLLVQLMIISLIINSAASESYSSMIRSHRKAAYAAFFVALLWYNLEDMQQQICSNRYAATDSLALYEFFLQRCKRRYI